MTTSEPTDATKPALSALDGCFWERRRRQASVPVMVGVVGLAVLGVAQQFPVRHAMEHDLTIRSGDAVRAAGVDGVTVRFEGRDAILSGTVTSPAQADSALRAVRDVRGVRVAHSHLRGTGATGDPATGHPPATSRPSQPAPTPGTAAPTRAASPRITAVISGGELTLTGTVGSGTARERLVRAAREAVRTGRVAGRIDIDPTVGEGRVERLAAVLGALGPDASVTVVLADGRLVLSGGAPSDEARRRAVAAAVVLTGDPAKVTNRLTVDEVAAVATALRSLPPVTFASGYSTLDAAGVARVRRVAGVLAAHPGVHVRVLGFTDDRGTADVNYGLSYARARTVYQLLQQMGIATSRLSFEAFGEKYPRLPNTTPENLAANRRVEFEVGRPAR